jgi:hypothetical protein
MSIDQRLSRISPALTAQERAILILESWKAGKQEDPAWRRSMPREQSQTFNHYIHLMNAANRFLGAYAGHLAHMAEKVGLRLAWLVSLTLWEEHIEEVRGALRLVLKEPITESEYATRVEEFRQEWMPVDEIAAFAAGESEAWADTDYTEDEDGERSITDEAWDRVCDEKERELRALVKSGKLLGRGRGKALNIQWGDYCRLIGRKVSAGPEDWLSYRILPDDQAEAAGDERLDFQRLLGVLDWRPFYASPDADLPKMPEKMIGYLRETTAYQLIETWVQVRAVDMILGEVAAEFGGADPVKPDVREKLDGTQRKLQSIHEQLLALNLEVELREPLEEELEELRGLMRQVQATW